VPQEFNRLQFNTLRDSYFDYCAAVTHAVHQHQALVEADARVQEKHSNFMALLAQLNASVSDWSSAANEKPPMPPPTPTARAILMRDEQPLPEIVGGGN
jgi:outer membrane protein TolC